MRSPGGRLEAVPVVGKAKARLSGVSIGKVAETSDSKQPEAQPDGAHAAASGRRKETSRSAAVARVVFARVIVTS